MASFVKTCFFMVDRDNWSATDGLYVRLDKAAYARRTPATEWFIEHRLPDGDSYHEHAAVGTIVGRDDEDPRLGALHGVLNELVEKKCDAPLCRFYTYGNGVPECVALAQLRIIYTVHGKHNWYEGNGWYVVHPDERERMERILAGTDNPLYDLVHELRYNPAVGAVGRDVAEAREHFDGNKRSRKE